MPEQEEKGRIVELPDDAIRMPPQRLPAPLGRISAGHPLRRPMAIALIVLAVLFLVYIVVSIASGAPPATGNDPTTFSEMHREPGAITYQDTGLRGWFLDFERQHFLAEDGRRFTYVDSHERKGWPVSGHWRLIE